MLKLFDSCVEPFLVYGCEVWGYDNVDILEKVHSVNLFLECPNTRIILPGIWRTGKISTVNKNKTENGSLLDEDIQK